MKKQKRAYKIGMTLAKITWLLFMGACLMVILSNYIQLELFTNGIYEGLNVFIPHELYDLIGHGQPLKDLHVIDNFYICIDCN